MAREILGGRMPTAAILISRKNYPAFLSCSASLCDVRGALSNVLIFECSVCTAGSTAEQLTRVYKKEMEA